MRKWCKDLAHDVLKTWIWAIVLVNYAIELVADKVTNLITGE